MCGIDESAIQEDIIEPYTRLFEHIAPMEYGTQITHDQVESIIEINRNFERDVYYTVISKANKLLTCQQKRLRSVRGQGYEVIQPDGYNNEIVKYIKRSRRNIKTSEFVSDNTPDELMSCEARSNLDRINQRLRSLTRSFDTNVKGIDRLRKIEVTIRTSSRENNRRPQQDIPDDVID